MVSRSVEKQHDDTLKQIFCHGMPHQFYLFIKALPTFYIKKIYRRLLIIILIPNTIKNTIAMKMNLTTHAWPLNLKLI